MTKHKNKKLHMHPVHFHLGMYLTMAALLVTTAKSSSELIRSLYAIPVHIDVVSSSTHLREAETVHGHMNLGASRRVFVSAQ